MSTADSPDDSDDSEVDLSHLEALQELARKEYGSDEIEIDDDADISEGNDGTWVQAWVFLSNETLSENNLLDPEDAETEDSDG